MSLCQTSNTSRCAFLISPLHFNSCRSQNNGASPALKEPWKPLRIFSDNQSCFRCYFWNTVTASFKITEPATDPHPTGAQKSSQVLLLITFWAYLKASQTKLRGWKALILTEGHSGTLSADRPPRGYTQKWTMGHGLFKFGPCAYWFILQLQLQIIKSFTPSLLSPAHFCLHFSGPETVRCPWFPGLERNCLSDQNGKAVANTLYGF